MIYDTFGPGETFGTSLSTPLYNYQFADGFTASASGTLQQITLSLGVSQISTPPNYADFFIWSDNSGSPPTLLEEIEVDAGAFSFTGQLVTADSVTHPYLTSGHRYYIGAAAVSPGTNPIIWFEASAPLEPGALEEYNFGGSWGLVDPQPTVALGALITVNDATPEPSAAWLASAGLLAALFFPSFRRKLGM